MSGEYYRLTPEGASTVLGVVSAICHGYSLDQVAALTGLEEADEVKVMLWMLCQHAGLVPPLEIDDDG